MFVKLANQKSTGQLGKLETQAGFLCTSLEADSFVQGTSFFVLEPSTD